MERITGHRIVKRTWPRWLQKTGGITVLLFLFLSTVQGVIVFNSSSEIRFNISHGERVDINATGMNLHSNSLYNYFGDNCGANEVVQRVNPDGTYVCTSLDTAGTDNQTLAEVLTQGNVANQSIDMGGNNISNVGNLTVAGQKGVAITNGKLLVGGTDESVNDVASLEAGTRSISIGTATASAANDAAAFGHNAIAGPSGIAIGRGVDAGFSGQQSVGAIAIGRQATVGPNNADYSIALGREATVQPDIEGAVAIGNFANAVNAYEATFGNLDGEELDVNVTGNLTVHGIGGADFQNNQINNVADPTEAQDAATKSYVDDNAGGDTEGLSQTLTANNTANQSIDMNDNAVSNAKEYDLGNGLKLRKDGNDIVLTDSG